MSRTIRFLVLTAVAVGTAFTGVAVAQTTGQAGIASPGLSRALSSSQSSTLTAAGAQLEERQAGAAEAREAQRRSNRADAVRRELLAAADAGEIAHSDAERVAADLAGYISGSRSFPESA